MSDRMLYRAEQAAEQLGVSRATLYELIRTGALTSIKIGRSRRISRAALETYVAGLTEGNGLHGDAA
jgi:excisionase family DNA binding protein